MSSLRPGPRNLITDVEGLRVGNAHDARLRSGVTVVLPDEPAVMAVDMRGGAPGTRETDALAPTCLVDAFHGVFLSGGSAFGLDAGAGVMAWLAARGQGRRVAPPPAPVVPVVPGAILFDLANGGDKDWGTEPPYRRLALEACAAAGLDFALGNAGAGFGALAGAYKGGLGSASAVDAAGLQVGALVAANPVGSPVIPGTATLWAFALEQDGELGHQVPPRLPSEGIDLDLPADGKIGALGPVGRGGEAPGGNTTIGIVATNAALTPAEAQRVAIMAQDGFARAVRPVHTPLDGDTLFVMATGRLPLAGPVALARLGTIAADCVARALARGVYAAESLGPYPCYRDIRRQREGA